MDFFKTIYNLYETMKPRRSLSQTKSHDFNTFHDYNKSSNCRYIPLTSLTDYGDSYPKYDVSSAVKELENYFGNIKDVTIIYPDPILFKNNEGLNIEELVDAVLAVNFGFSIDGLKLCSKKGSLRQTLIPVYDHSKVDYDGYKSVSFIVHKKRN